MLEQNDATYKFTDICPTSDIHYSWNVAFSQLSEMSDLLGTWVHMYAKNPINNKNKVQLIHDRLHCFDATPLQYVMLRQSFTKRTDDMTLSPGQHVMVVLLSHADMLTAVYKSFQWLQLWFSKFVPTNCYSYWPFILSLKLSSLEWAFMYRHSLVR